MSEFRITSNKGFHVTFANGWTVSVQFGPGNYCENRDGRIGRDEEDCGKRGSMDAEVAAWGKDGKLIPFPEGDSVRGWQSPASVLALMAAAESGALARGEIPAGNEP